MEQSSAPPTTLSSPSTDANRFDFLPMGKSFLPFEWSTLGAAFRRNAAAASGSKPGDVSADLTGRCSFVMSQGYDPLDMSSTGRVLEGDGDMGFAIRLQSFAIGVTASNLTLKAGLDNPLAPGVASAGKAPALKATVAKEFAEDAFIAASYDLKARKPEFAVCWAGETFTEKATVCLTADPIYRALKISAAVSFAGTEWRETVYDEDNDVIEEPKDDGGRHRLWVRTEARQGNLLHSTAVGGSLDLGRLVNFVCDFVDYRLEPRFPPLVWAIPGSQLLYNLLIPAEDEDQVRHHIRGWDLDVSHEFGRRGPRVALVKSFKAASLAATWDQHAQEAGLEYAVKGLRVGARLGRLEGLGWRTPSIFVMAEPLSLL